MCCSCIQQNHASNFQLFLFIANTHAKIKRLWVFRYSRYNAIKKNHQISYINRFIVRKHVKKIISFIIYIIPSHIKSSTLIKCFKMIICSFIPILCYYSFNFTFVWVLCYLHIQFYLKCPKSVGEMLKICDSNGQEMAKVQEMKFILKDLFDFETEIIGKREIKKFSKNIIVGRECISSTVLYDILSINI